MAGAFTHRLGTFEATGGAFVVGFPDELGNGDYGLSSDLSVGCTYTVPQDGNLTQMGIRGGTIAGGGNFRLVIYAATSGASWGAKLGETAPTTGVAANAVVELDLLSPVAVTNGQLIALVIHCGSGVPRLRSMFRGGGDRYFWDTFADGAVSPAPGTASNSTSSAPCIWARGV